MYCVLASWICCPPIESEPQPTSPTFAAHGAAGPDAAMRLRVKAVKARTVYRTGVSRFASGMLAAALIALAMSHEGTAWGNHLARPAMLWVLALFVVQSIGIGTSIAVNRRHGSDEWIVGAGPVSSSCTMSQPRRPSSIMNESLLVEGKRLGAAS